MISAGKTGTTNEKKDGWFVGYTPYYTTGVWVGYDIPKAMNELSGATFPGSIWKQYMNAIHKGLENKEFAPYEDNRAPQETLEETVETQDTIETTETQETIDENTGSEDQDSGDGDVQDETGDGSEDTADLPGDNTDDGSSDDNGDGSTYDDGQDGLPGTDDPSDNNTEDGSWSDEDSWNNQRNSMDAGTPTP